MKKIIFITIILLTLITIYVLVKKESTKENNVIKQPISEEKLKLKELNNIDQKISYFNYNNIDRYITYKNNNENLNIEDIITYVNIGLDYEFYENIKESEITNNILVNKYNKLSISYIPSNLESISSIYSSKKIEVTKDTKEAFESLSKQAKEENLTIIAVSGYRSYLYQEAIYNNYLKKDTTVNVDTYSARPGHSEHQTGLAIDVSNNESSYTYFGNTPEFNWMKNNAHKYGFIIRYPENKEFITGYTYEPWHYRYVGIEIATKIYNENMTFDEYYIKKIEKH